MDALLSPSLSPPLSRLRSAACPVHRPPPSVVPSAGPGLLLNPASVSANRASGPCKSPAVAAAAAGGALAANPVPPKSSVYTVGDFMTRKEDLHVVKPYTTVDEGISEYHVSGNFDEVRIFTHLVLSALEMLVENRITGFPVIDDDWKLVCFLFYPFR
ncbi:hypothetical protein EUGRSUZ_H01700 [Eucalyptus grandis]|uniref:Uncharacterized protein n=2 Tax=Eucalyptus grandis TaxID=71139 RepID=A0ACC3JPS4_EUCGR|nr:hypothetical protein EUGRSUZ_H01700 [Eucalyptus grandis]